MTIPCIPSGSLFSCMAVCSLLLCGCGESAVPDVDPHKIVVEGKPMTGPEFIDKYCRDKLVNKTCEAVHRAISVDAGNRPMPKGW